MTGTPYNNGNQGKLFNINFNSNHTSNIVQQLTNKSLSTHRYGNFDDIHRPRIIIGLY